MSGPPVKRSLTLRGHRTSVSLEAPFWDAFRRIAEADGKAVNALAAEIDAEREVSTGLASAIRVYVLERTQRGIAEGQRSRS
ncbi:ribbon-helix-helix domain-containing protein [Roseivivax sediminis]|uniref:Ribbon-helix-helix domain-containing protein n=1 Tax=Roseivivax sediminis TaxID=936889 RepID=A0A1I1SE88_9RHOB|nr:ribbon-helix-helix domain-containing protein [Roseivivax sediminis]SFD44814.1 Ribbon-helix-helix domain-containing protein [Roseivivax sediminis]